MHRAPLLLALLFALPRPALGFEILHSQDGEPIRWADPGAIALAVFPPAQGLLPGADGTVEAVLRSLDSWEAVDGSAVAFDATLEEGTPPALGFDRQRPGENVNAVVFVGEGWDYDPAAYAVTLRTVSSTSGNLLDADVAVNALAHSWRVLPERASAEAGAHGPADVESVMAHEIGHLLGLEHNDVDEEVTMFPTLGYGEIWMRTLAADDEAGARHLYADLGQAKADDPRSGGALAGGGGGVSVSRMGCSAGSGEGSPWAVLLVLGAAALVRLRRRGAAGVVCLRRRWAAAGTPAALVALVALAATPAAATTVPDRSLETLTARAELVVRGTVLSVESRWRSGRIYTEVLLATHTCLKGPCEFTVSFEQPGGELDGLRQEVVGAPVVGRGQEVVVLLDRRGERLVPFLGGGVWEVVRDAEGREQAVARGGRWRLVPLERLAAAARAAANGSARSR